MEMNRRDGVNIGTVSGGIVNFGGAIVIAPISVTKTTSGAGGNNSGAFVKTRSGLSVSNQRAIREIVDLIKTVL